MRFIFLALFLIGAGVAFAYPWAMRNVSSHQIGSWRVEDVASGFHPVDVPLKSADAPVKAVLDVTAVVPASFDREQNVLTITAATMDKTVLAQSLSLEGAEKREELATDASTDLPHSGWNDPGCSGGRLYLHRRAG